MVLLNGDQTESYLDVPAGLSAVCDACHHHHQQLEMEDGTWSCQYGYNLPDCQEAGNDFDPAVMALHGVG